MNASTPYLSQPSPTRRDVQTQSAALRGAALAFKGRPGKGSPQQPPGGTRGNIGPPQQKSTRIPPQTVPRDGRTFETDSVRGRIPERPFDSQGRLSPAPPTHRPSPQHPSPIARRDADSRSASIIAANLAASRSASPNASPHHTGYHDGSPKPLRTGGDTSSAASLVISSPRPPERIRASGHGMKPVASDDGMARQRECLPGAGQREVANKNLETFPSLEDSLIGAGPVVPITSLSSKDELQPLTTEAYRAKSFPTDGELVTSPQTGFSAPGRGAEEILKSPRRDHEPRPKPGSKRLAKAVTQCWPPLSPDGYRHDHPGDGQVNWESRRNLFLSSSTLPSARAFDVDSRSDLDRAGRDRQSRSSSPSSDDTFHSTSSSYAHRASSRPSIRLPTGVQRRSQPALGHPDIASQSPPRLVTHRLPLSPSPIRALRNAGLNDQNGVPHPPLALDSLTDAIVAGSLASERRSRSDLGVSSQSSNKRHSLRPSRSPPKNGMRQTLRSQQSTPDDDGARRQKERKRGSLGRNHAHNEALRRRWREQVSAAERRRYEAVWASNRGLFLEPALDQPDNDASVPRNNVGPGLRNHNDKNQDAVANIVVRELWGRSRLPCDELFEVWQLVDNTCSGKLSKEEFVVGTWLIDQRLRGRKIPTRVSQSVWDSVKGLRVLPPSSRGPAEQ